MRAMPSPTDSTCPTSATSASVPNSAICFFRIAEISAARISISTDPLHHQREPRQLALERCVDHARAHLDDQSAEQVRIDAKIDRHLATDRFAQALVERLALSRGQFLRRAHLRRHLAAALRENAEKSLNHFRQREQPPVARQKAKKMARRGLGAGALADGADRAR